MRETVRLFEILRCEEEGHAAVAVERFDVSPDRVPPDRVEPGRGLVEEDDFRIVDERGREVEPPLHAAGVCLDETVGRIIELDYL